MTPKEKALDICEKMGFIKGQIMAINYMSKRYSIVAVDEIIGTVKSVSSNEIELDEFYWRQVKQEIEKL